MATTKNLGTCAVCMRRQVVWDGSMVLHGYQRPGWGWITGDCFGTRRPAWEVSPEAAVEYVAMIRGLLANTVTHLAWLRAGKATVFHRTETVYDERKYIVRVNGVVQTKQVPVNRGEDGFADMERSAIRGAEQRQRDLTDHIAELDARIAAWKPAALLPHDAPPPVEEKPVEIVWEPKCSQYVARRPGTTRGVGRGDDPAAVYAEVNRKGWTLPEGVALPARVPTSERLRAALGGRKPWSLADVNRDRVDCFTAAKLLALYEAADGETRRVIDEAPLPQLLSFTRDTAERGRVEGVNAAAAVARLRLHNALTSRPEAEQPATLLAGEWTRVTFVDVYYAEPRTVTIERSKARLHENRVEDRATRKSFWFDWISDVHLEA